MWCLQDALTLQRLFVEKKRALISNDPVQNLVSELMLRLFIQLFNFEVDHHSRSADFIDDIFQDQDGQYVTDSFSELPEQAENEP